MHKTFLFHKPFGVLSQFTREVPSHRVIGDYYDFPTDVYPVGRLDKDSEGLLLLTNRKKLIDSLLNPKARKSKTYLVQVDGAISQDAIRKLSLGVQITLPNKKKHLTLPCQVNIYDGVLPEERDPPIRYRANIPTSWIEITLHEGKNRQIRKMCAAVGYPVLRLIRISLHEFYLGDLKPGEVIQVDIS